MGRVPAARGNRQPPTYARLVAPRRCASAIVSARCLSHSPNREGICAAGRVIEPAPERRRNRADLAEPALSPVELSCAEAHDLRQIASQRPLGQRGPGIADDVDRSQPGRLRDAHTLLRIDPAVGDGLAPVAIDDLREGLIVHVDNGSLGDVADRPSRAWPSRDLRARSALRHREGPARPRGATQHWRCCRTGDPERRPRPAETTGSAAAPRSSGPADRPAGGHSSAPPRGD